jgi:hypothetical protein
MQFALAYCMIAKAHALVPRQIWALWLELVQGQSRLEVRFEKFLARLAPND